MGNFTPVSLWEKSPQHTMNRMLVIHVVSWVVAVQTPLVKYTDKKFIKVQTQWKPSVTNAAVPVYKLTDPGSGVRPISVPFRTCCSSGKDQWFWGLGSSVGRSRKGLRNALYIYIRRPYMNRNGGNKLSRLVVVIIIIIMITDHDLLQNTM